MIGLAGVEQDQRPPVTIEGARVLAAIFQNDAQGVVRPPLLRPGVVGEPGQRLAQGLFRAIRVAGGFPVDRDLDLLDRKSVV